MFTSFIKEQFLRCLFLYRIAVIGREECALIRGILAYFVDEFDTLRDVRELQDLPPLLALALVTIGTT